MKKESDVPEVGRFLDAWFAVRQFIQAANFNRFQGAGLSATQFMILNILPSDEVGLAIGELARRMNLKPATIAKTVDSLEARNMITRVRTAPDKRVVYVRVTKIGVELQNAASESFRQQIESVFETMLPEERKGLIVGLESLVRATQVRAGHKDEARESASTINCAQAPHVSAPAERSARLSRRR